MPAARAASSRLIPSEALASASSRLLTRPSRSRRASARSSAGVRPVAIGTATMAQAPGLLSLPGQLAARRRRSRLPVAGMTGDRPFQRLATLTSTHPSYISGRLLRATDLGFPPRLTLDPEEPLGDVLPRLERFRPEFLFDYPSAIAPVARAQADGRARLRPRRVIGAGEAVTPAFREAVRAAWGREVEVLDLYATTETGALAVEAPDGRGRYLLEDATLVEVVDGRGRPVPDGERGGHPLITRPGRAAPPPRPPPPLPRPGGGARPPPPPRGGAGPPPFRRVRAIEGRREDALRLENGRGE